MAGRRVLAHLAAFEATVLGRVTRADLRGFYNVLEALDTLPAASPPTKEAGPGTAGLQTRHPSPDLKVRPTVESRRARSRSR